MTYDERSQRAAKPEKDESFFLLGMIGVGDQQRVLIEKHSLGLLKRYPVLTLIVRILAFVPLESEGLHPL